MRLQPDRLKIVNLHASSIGPFWALTGPLAMSLGVSESWDIEFIDIVDNKYNLFLENTSMVNCWWQKFKFVKIHEISKTGLQYAQPVVSSGVLVVNSPTWSPQNEYSLDVFFVSVWKLFHIFPRYQYVSTSWIFSRCLSCHTFSDRCLVR